MQLVFSENKDVIFFPIHVYSYQTLWDADATLISLQTPTFDLRK